MDDNVGSFLVFLIIGICAGWLAGQIVKGGDFGLVGDMVVGVIGALIGGYLFGALGVLPHGWVGWLISATVGAVILLVVLRLVRRKTL